MLPSRDGPAKGTETRQEQEDAEVDYSTTEPLAHAKFLKQGFEKLMINNLDRPHFGQAPPITSFIING